MSYHSIKDIFGVNGRARNSTKKDNNDPFKNPIIHKRIDGQVIVPIDTERLWGR
ncbi:hypothetical protein KHA94_09115 [Bacillus sp. FJAT-49705]|uniref:Uncharacterized protein n=1 Tax=Cytobacillus citreus TaxID=2833586 RepID=A0ABS5NRB2_9BACI|nr:hypothetical protein [Cytobacillus citreus]MBS4190360.1 hypothetical protein [Cytobacillus citreus]